MPTGCHLQAGHPGVCPSPGQAENILPCFVPCMPTTLGGRLAAFSPSIQMLTSSRNTLPHDTPPQKPCLAKYLGTWECSQVDPVWLGWGGGLCRRTWHLGTSEPPCPKMAVVTPAWWGWVGNGHELVTILGPRHVEVVMTAQHSPPASCQGQLGPP